MELGYCEGDTCGREGCKGTVKEHPVNNCSCHLNPPCGACTSPRGFCSDCGWEESEDPAPPPEPYKSKPWEPAPPRPLDPTKVDWRYVPHTNFTMIKGGVYPPHMTREEVEKELRGTFGGRFEKFKDGHFKYVAYTD